MAWRCLGVSPGGDAHGAGTRSGLWARKSLPGCGSAHAGTHSLGPASCCSHPEYPWHWAPSRSACRAAAPQRPPAATFPQGGTLPGKTIPPTWVSPGSTLVLTLPCHEPLISVFPSQNCPLSSSSLQTSRPPNTLLHSYPPSHIPAGPSLGLVPPGSHPGQSCPPQPHSCTSFTSCSLLVSECLLSLPALVGRSALSSLAGGAQGSPCLCVSESTQSPKWQRWAHVGP